MVCGGGDIMTVTPAICGNIPSSQWCEVINDVLRISEVHIPPVVRERSTQTLNKAKKNPINFKEFYTCIYLFPLISQKLNLA